MSKAFENICIKDWLKVSENNENLNNGHFQPNFAEKSQYFQKIFENSSRSISDWLTNTLLRDPNCTKRSPWLFFKASSYDVQQDITPWKKSILQKQTFFVLLTQGFERT